MKNILMKQFAERLALCIAGGMLAACGGDASTSDSQAKLLVSAGSVKISIPTANVTASSTDAANVPGNAVDNNLGTHWTGGAASGNQWIQFKLPSCYTTDFANISWYNGDARQYGYTIEASADDGASWTTVKTGTTSGTSAALVQVDFPDTNATMMRLSSSGSNVSTKVSINEVEFWGSTCSGATTTAATTTTTTAASTTTTDASTTTTGATTTTTLASAAVRLTIPAANVTASDTESSTYAPAFAVDDNTATRWSSGAVSGTKWIKLNLGGCYKVDYAKLGWYTGVSRMYNYTIKASADNGATWTVVKTGNTDGTTSGRTVYDFPDVSANVISLESTGSNVSTTVALSEVEIWQLGAGTCNGSVTTTTTTTSSSSGGSSSTVGSTTTTTAAAGWTGWRVNGKNIVDNAGNNVLMKGFGPGEWTNTEAYMIQWPDEDPGTTAHASQYGASTIQNTLVGIMGATGAAQYAATWKANDVTEADFARMQAWGANSLRLSINYHWLSPSNGTYLQTGWQWLDQVVAWGKAHNIRIVFCMHAAPGAQSNELMSDTVGATARLWTEPTTYQPWTTNMWQAIATRYAGEAWVAGYDLLDEPIPPKGKEADVRKFYLAVTSAIRAVDTNHIIFVEGLNWAGDTAGMTAMLPPWDNNMVYTFHKYWDTNNTASIQGYLDIRNQYNVPIWNGETGEEQTTGWNKGMATLLAANNIGWNFWTYKKVADVGNAPYSIPEPANYSKILTYVNCLTPTKTTCTKPTQADSNTIMLALAANAATSKSTYQSAVISELFGTVTSFAVSANPLSQSITSGSSTSYALSLMQFGYTGSVTLAVTGLPTGATASFSPASVASNGASTLNVTTSSATPAGSYTLTITGTGGSKNIPVKVVLKVQ